MTPEFRPDALLGTLHLQTIKTWMQTDKVWYECRHHGHRSVDAGTWRGPGTNKDHRCTVPITPDKLCWRELTQHETKVRRHEITFLVPSSVDPDDVPDYDDHPWD